MKKTEFSSANIFADGIKILMVFTFLPYQVRSQDSLAIQKADTTNVQQTVSQNSFATIYFYRQRRVVGEEIEYNVVRNGAAIARMKSGSVFVYQCKNGEQTFTSTKGGKTSLTLNVIDGKQYFVECGLTISATTQPTLNQTTSAKAKKEIARIDKSVADLILINVDSDNNIQAEKLKQQESNNINVVHQQADTIRALQHLYKRKRLGGILRASIGGGIGFGMLINLINDANSTQTIQVSNYQTISINDSPPASDYILVGSFTVAMVASGSAQRSAYSYEKLDLLLKDYSSGNPLPKKIKLKLKKKDFK